MCLETLFGTKVDKPAPSLAKAPEPLPTKNDEDVKEQGRLKQIAAMNRKGFGSTIKNLGGAAGIDDSKDSTKRTTLGGTK